MTTSASFLFRVFVSNSGPGTPVGGAIEQVYPAFTALSMNAGARFVIDGGLLADRFTAPMAARAKFEHAALPFTAATVA